MYWIIRISIFAKSKQGNAGQIICHIEPEIWAEVDETLYIRMMINLLSNALRYGEGRDIEVSLSVHNDSDIIGKVKDHGIGISKGDIPHIWERFYRADKSRTGGSHCGLGLSMVKWIAEAHGGSVEVVSKEGEGSEFVFHLRKSKSWQDNVNLFSFFNVILIFLGYSNLIKENKGINRSLESNVFKVKVNADVK